jgi:16S rRNA (cytosine967-C5)-methyltransferase
VIRFQSYFNTTIKIIQLYDGTIPLQHFLKQYFSQYKKHGSKDRKYIMHLCYCFYRLGKAFVDINAEERLKLAIFLCNNKTGEWDFLFDKDWLNNRSNVLSDRISFVQTKYDSFFVKNVFPFADEVSNTLDVDAFSRSFFVQPDVFIRTRPGCFDKVVNKLQESAVLFNVINDNCIALSPSVNIDTILDIGKEAVIQDYSSQRVKTFFELTEYENRTSEIAYRKSVWDCCAGSGGKSILAYDILNSIELTVSDVRPSIIQNLKQRFVKAGIKNYKSFVADIANSKPRIQNLKPDLLICDAPCTGSGTWSRTPEQLFFFDEKRINDYSSLQQKIVTNAIGSLNEQGYFLYITCSVFKKENEAMVDFIQQQFQPELIKMKLIQGYDKKADSMFAALFRKN